MNDANKMPSDPQKALMVLRLIWGALLGGLVVLAVVMTMLTQVGSVSGDPMIGGVVAGFAGLGLLIGVPLGLFLRGQTFKKHWSGDAVTPEGYSQGCIIAWATIEGPATIGLIAVLLGGSIWPYGLPAAVAIGLLIALWPNGKVMEPQQSAEAQPLGHRES